MFRNMFCLLQMAQVGSHGDDMTNSTIQALAFVGSLRVASYNQALLRAAIERSPRELEMDVFDLARVPFYNADLEADGDPDSVSDLKRKIHASDLVFIVTPEYNQGMSAVTKNMIDWASRPPRPQAWDGKPIAIMGTTPGPLGTAAAQRALRECLSSNNARVMPQPRLLLGGANSLFDQDFKMVNEAAMERLEKFMSAAIEWARLFQRS